MNDFGGLLIVFCLGVSFGSVIIAVIYIIAIRLGNRKRTHKGERVVPAGDWD